MEQRGSQARRFMLPQGFTLLSPQDDFGLFGPGWISSRLDSTHELTLALCSYTDQEEHRSIVAHRYHMLPRPKSSVRLSTRPSRAPVVGALSHQWMRLHRLCTWRILLCVELDRRKGSPPISAPRTAVCRCVAVPDIEIQRQRTSR